MDSCFILVMLISIANGCAPSIPTNDPVLTSTLTSIISTTSTSSSSTTTTVPTSSSTTTPADNTTTPVTTTTTALTTTTPLLPLCCPYPTVPVGLNTANPSEANWNKCNSSISIFCQPPTSGYTSAAVVANVTSNTMLYAIYTQPINVTRTIACNTTTQLWYDPLNTDTSKQFIGVTCAAYYLEDSAWRFV